MLGNEWITATVLPLLFILWLISSGISSLVHSFDLKRFGVSGWGLMTAWGAVEIVFGVVSLFKPVAAVVAMAILIGITFVIEGIKMLITAFFIPAVFCGKWYSRRLFAKWQRVFVFAWMGIRRRFLQVGALDKEQPALPYNG